MALRDKTNGELFQLYDSDLILRLRNKKNLSDTRRILSDFWGYLGEYPPSPELAKGFLARYADRKPRTLYRYAQMVKAFMKWYGEPLDDVNVKVPRSLPAYTEDADIEKLLAVVGEKRSHKQSIRRDRLLVVVAWRTGMRRGELAALKVGSVHADSVMVREGKGGKDRLIPLPQGVASDLNDFVRGKAPGESVFGLGGPTIGMKIKQWARKAGLTDFHTHTLRHKYATDLLESGANVRVVQTLLGHENLNTTQVYLSITEQGLYDAVRRLDQPRVERTGQGKAGPPMGELLRQQQANMLRLVERWRNELNLSLDLALVKDFSVGLRSVPVQRSPRQPTQALLWQVTKEGAAYLRYPLEIDETVETRIIRDHLWQHLRSGGYGWLLDDGDRGMPKWKRLGGEELRTRGKLLKKIEAEVRRQSGKSLMDDYRPITGDGPTIWIAESIWSAALDGLYANLYYHPAEQAKDQEGKPLALFMVRYGARPVGSGATRQEAEDYRELHKRLMVQFCNSSVAEDVRKLRAERNQVSQVIDEALARMVVNRYVPDSCEECGASRG